MYAQTQEIICQQLASGSREYEYKLTMKGERDCQPITDGRRVTEARIPQGTISFKRAFFLVPFVVEIDMMPPLGYSTYLLTNQLYNADPTPRAHT